MFGASPSDPTTSWQGKDKTWRMLVGCGDGEVTCSFKSKDFVQWDYTGAFHKNLKDNSMWECQDGACWVRTKTILRLTSNIQRPTP